MPILLLALLLFQEPTAPARENASGFTFARPKGWTRQDLPNQSVALQPPAPDSAQATILILQGSDSDLDPATGHERLFESICQGGTMQGGVATSTVSGWQRSQVTLATPQQTVWTTLYSTKSGRRFEAVMLVAASEKLDKAFKGTVEKLISSIEFPGAAKAPAPAAGAIHGLLIPVPATWVRKDEPTGVVLLVPPQLAGVRQYSLAVLPPTKFQGTRWETHQALLKNLLGQVKWAEDPVIGHVADGPGPFVRSSVAGKIPEGGLTTIELYSAGHDGVLEAVVGIGGIDRNVTDPVLKATTLKSPPKASARPAIVEAYRRADQKLTVNREGGALTAGSLMYERIWLRSDGSADFTTTYPEGYAAAPVVLKQDPGMGDGYIGRWMKTGDTIQIVRRDGSPADVYEAVTGGGIRGGGKTWEAMPRVDGLKLSGRWGLKSPPEQKGSPYYTWIEFTPDGKFSTEGALTYVSTGDVDRPKPPDKASGTYEIRDWTMFFTFADGGTWSTDFSIVGQDPGNFPAILFRTFALPRDK